MTLEKLLGYTAEQLKTMPAAEWQKILEPYLNVTRPDRVTKPTSKTGQSSKQRQNNSIATGLLKGLGIDLDL